MPIATVPTPNFFGNPNGGIALGGGSFYPSSPAPSAYNPTFGGVPGNVAIPNPFQDISNVFPGLSGANTAASSDLLDELQGKISPETQNMLKDAAARFGIKSGMPLSGLADNSFLRNLGLSIEQRRQQGLADYSRLIPTVAQTQTVSPALQAEIASHNAAMNAAPVPAAAQSYAQRLFDQYLQSRFGGPGGGTRGDIFSPAGGTGSFTPGQQPLGGGGTAYDPFGPGGEFDYFGALDSIPTQSSFDTTDYGSLGPVDSGSSDFFSTPTLDELINTGEG